MNQTERRVFLIQELLKEEPRYRRISVPGSTQEQRQGPVQRQIFRRHDAEHGIPPTAAAYGTGSAPTTGEAGQATVHHTSQWQKRTSPRRT